MSWLVDLHRKNQLDLDPPYQRRSVWTRKDRQFFLDTIFRGYPSPAIFLHKTIGDDGTPTYHVVDGKQRLETILSFLDNRLRLPTDFGDNRLAGKRWRDLKPERDLQNRLWNYQVPVEMVDVGDGGVVNEVFDRLNRNSRKLARQELRHAKFDGWFISFAENESARAEWKELGIATTARARRMADVQIMSELMLVVLEEKIRGFDQDDLDTMYAKYDSLEDLAQEHGIDFSEDGFEAEFRELREYLVDVHGSNAAVGNYVSTLAHLYPLWALVALDWNALGNAEDTAKEYVSFMSKVDRLSEQKDLEAFLQGKSGYQGPLTYWDNVRGANTDHGPRQSRFDALQNALRA